jgi:hypothetical protein
MEDHSGPTDATLENSAPVILEITSSDEIAQWVGVNLKDCSDEEEVPEFSSIEELTQWLGVDDA